MSEDKAGLTFIAGVFHEETGIVGLPNLEYLLPDFYRETNSCINEPHYPMLPPQEVN